MQITLQVSDQIMLEAKSQGMPLPDFVEMLVARGFEALEKRASVATAMKQIRALRLVPSRGER